jgi:regulatory protein
MDSVIAALRKLKQFCAYQDRCHKEVNDKLWELGIKEAERNEIIATLITEGYLNEERFARSFAGGKFRMKRWGRKKIIQALRRHQISPYCIARGLEEIPDTDYRDTLLKLASDKYGLLKKHSYLTRKQHTFRYLLAKGYEAELIHEVLDELAGPDSPGR